MRKQRTTFAAIAAALTLIVMTMFAQSAAAQPSGPGLILPAPTAEYVLSDNPTAEPLLQTEFTLGVTALATTTQTVEMTIEAPSDFLVLSAGGGYSKETTFTHTFDNTSLGGLIQIDPNGQPLTVTFASSDDVPGYTVQLQAVAAPDPNATAAPAGSGAQSGSSLPDTPGDEADDLTSYLNQQQVDPNNELQAFPFSIDGRHMLALGVGALGIMGIFALRRRRRAAR